MSDLKPCPFCESTDIRVKEVLDEADHWVAYCLGCNAQGPVNYNSCKDCGENEAQRDWNRRAGGK